MPTSPKTFRVFVSSTFTDMRAERRLLQGKVFPDLKKYCEVRGASFQAVDLRWGVNEESQREQKVMEICLTEIARCQRLSPRPNFIVLLGDRYGWQPVPNKIPAAEMAELLTHLNGEEAELIRSWYREDTNAIPPEYVLQPRGAEYRDYDHWQAVEDRLRATLRTAADKTNFAGEQRIKYFASATHQEIINGALQPPATGIDPADHVFAYLREMDPPPQGEKAADYLDLLPDGTVDLYAKAQMDGLKEELGGKLPHDHIYKYEARRHEGAQFEKGVLEAFAAKVYQDLVSVIDQELPEITPLDELTREKKLQADFARRLTRFFTGQEEPRLQIAAYLQQVSGKPFALIGPSGSGKSSLMAQALEEAAGGFPGVIIYRFIGATSASSNLLLLLRQVCEEIAEAYHTSLPALLKEGEDDKKLGTHYGLSEIFSRCLDLATEDRPLLLFLDALDQLQSERFDFLPHTLPDQVRIVVSALPELEERLAFAEVCRLPMMSTQDGEALIGAWLAEEKRRITGEQRQEVINKFKENGLPLYLKLAFEQARQWHSYDAGKVLPADVNGILAGYFDLLEKEHTRELVRRVAGYLLSGKYRGLTEAEILDLLVFDREFWKGFLKRSHPDHREEIEKLERLPFVVWSRLFLDLEPYLTERDADGLPIISFYHRQFMEFAGERYLRLAAAGKIPPYPPLEKGGLKEDLCQRGGLEEVGVGGDLAIKFHATLAGYFETRSLYLDEAEQKPNVRKVVEQPYQETMAGRWEALAEKCLTDFPFLMAKARADLMEGILEDYGLAFEKMPQDWRKKLRFWEAFFRERAHILRRGQDEWPADKILLQLAVEHADDSPVTQGAERYLAAGKCDWSWLRREQRLKHAGLDPCLAVLEGHTSSVLGAIVLSGGRIISWSGDQTLRLWDRAGKPLAILAGHTDRVDGALALPDGRILSWSADKTLRLWDRYGKPLAVLDGHSDSVWRALALPGGRILSWSDDKTLRLWDTHGKPLAVLEGHTKGVNGALALPDGRLLSCSSDKTLRLWDRVGKPLAVLEGHADSVFKALLLSDGRLLSWSFDKTLRLWDPAGQPFTVLVGHSSGVRGALALPDGRILSWSNWHDKTLRLWDRAGKPLAVLSGHTSEVNGALALPDGWILSWAKLEMTLRLWDRAGKPLAVLEGHTNEAIGSLALSDGRLLSWSHDGTLRLWDRAGKHLSVLEGHTAAVFGALALPDGRILSWSSDDTLRLWDRAGKPLAVLEGHTREVNGSLVLSDGRMLSWSDDKTLRLWDRAGKPLAILKGHTHWVSGALVLPDGRLLSWSGNKTLSWGDKTLRLWDKAGKPLEVYGLDEGLQLYPEARRAFYGPNCVYGKAYLTDQDNSAILAWDQMMPDLVWHGASECRARLLQLDGRAVVTQENGQVCIIQLYHGNHPITLDDLEAIATAAAGSHHIAEPPGQRTPETAV